MSKFSGIGVLSLVTGLALIVFKMIGSVMGKDSSCTDFTLTQLVSPDNLSWVNTMPDGAMHNLMNTLVSTPLFVFCLIIGIVFLVVSGFMGK